MSLIRHLKVAPKGLASFSNPVTFLAAYVGGDVDRGIRMTSTRSATKSVT